MARTWYFQFSNPAALLEVSGEDAFTFLQGQFSNDLRTLSTENAIYGLWLDRRGRIQGDSFIHRFQPNHDNIILNKFMLLSLSTKAAVIESHLDRHIIADDVCLRDISEKYILLSVLIPDGGTEDLEKLTKIIGQSSSSNALFRENFTGIVDGRFLHCHVVHWPVLTAADQNSLRTRILDWKMSQNVEFLEDSDVFEKQRILEQIPCIPGDLNPDNFPGDGNLEEGIAFSLSKGCYLGQEVMLRKKSTQRKTRRLQCVVSNSAISPGDPVFSQTRLAGKITSSISCGQSWLGLALLRTSQVDETGQLALDGEGKSVLHCHESE